MLSSPEYVRAAEGPAKGGRRRSEDKVAASAAQLEAIVPPGRYDGVYGTMYAIVNEEGSKVVPPKLAATKGAPKRGKTKVAETVYRRGQGMEGLWRGWKVSWWGLVGLWGAAVVGGGGDGEF